MCGIIGASSSVELNTSDIKLLYLMSENRGRHSCGFTDTNIIRRMVGAPDEFICDEIFNGTYKQFIGHTRFATVGDKDDIGNVHPFKFKKVIGVHNGTIFNHEDLQKEENVAFKVDSKVLYYLINNYGLRKTLPRLKGKLALAYYDVMGKDRSNWVLNLFRFDRPLYIGYKGLALFYGSEEDYLKAVGCSDIKEIPENTVYKIRQGKILSVKQVKKKHRPQEHVTQTTTHYTKSNTNTTPITSASIVKPVRRFYAPVHAELVQLEKAGKEYFKLFWFDDDDYNKVYVETDELSQYYYYYILNDVEGKKDLKDDHPDIVDEILDAQHTIKQCLFVREEAEGDANGYKISKTY